MIIQHNIPALNAHRNMGINNAGIAGNLEKLSSGYRINRAGDDAAGLAISEKMRGQIRGLAMAEQNTENGVSLIQTAEGGLNETHAILQRMRELAVQSSNGTYQTEDREQITKEYNALLSEVDRIAQSTHYNGIKLLNGNLSTDLYGKATLDANGILKGAVLGSAATANTDYLIDVGTVTDTPEVIATYTSFTQTLGALTAGTGVGGAITFDFGGETGLATTALAANATVDQIAQAMADAINADGTLGAALKAEADGAGGIKITARTAGAATAATIGAYTFANVTKDVGTSPIVLVGTKGTVTDGVDAAAAVKTLTGATVNGTALAAADIVYNDRTDAYEITSGGNLFVLDASRMKTNDTVTVTATNGENLVFQIGANGGQDQRVYLKVADMSSFAIGMKAGDSWASGVVLAADRMLFSSSVDTIDNANEAIEIISAATNMVSGQRAELGALQNRLESTLNSLGVTKENLTAAESVIRDVDMAKEMMEFTKNSILVQASQAMLAQANQLPQGVLSLLR